MLTAFVTFNALLTACISIFGGFGNFLIIVAFIKTKSLQTINNVFLFQLAIVDFTKAIFILSTKAYTQFADEHYVAKEYCQFSGFISCITFIHSALLLAAIAVVRYIKIVKSRSFDKVFTRRRMIYYCAGLAAATTLLALLPLVGVGRYSYSDYHGVCFANWESENHIFRTLFYVYVMGVCFPVLVFCYTCIFFSLRKHKQRILKNVRLARQRSAQKQTLKAALTKKSEEGSYRKMECSSNLQDLVQEGGDEKADGDGETKAVKWAVKIGLNYGEADPSGENSTEENETDMEVNEEEANESNQKLDNGRTEQKEVEMSSMAASSNGNHLSPNSADGDGERPKSRKISFPNITRTKENAANKTKEVSLSSHAVRNEIRITKVMFTVVIAFSLCWLPAFFTTVLQLSNVARIPPNGLYIIITLVDLKVLLNPLIYGIWNKQFRRALKAIFVKGLADLSSTRDADSKASQSQSNVN